MEALDQVRPYLDSHGGGVELLDVTEGVARIRLEGSCKTCPASSATLELAVKQALDEAAPDLAGLIVEGIQDASRSPRPASTCPCFRSGRTATEEPGVEDRRRRRRRFQHVGRRPPGTTWRAVERSPRAASRPPKSAARPWPSLESTARYSRSATAVPSCSSPVDRRHAFRRQCSPVPSAAPRYDLPRAGLATDGGAQLDPVPLLAEAGGVRVASAGMTEDAQRQRQRRPRPADGQPRRADLVSGLRGLRPARTGSGTPRVPGATRQPGSLRSRGQTPVQTPVSSATCVELPSPTTTATCSSSPNGASSAPARSALPRSPPRPSSGPVGHKVTWLDDLEMADEMWARLGIPIALAFFTQRRHGRDGRVLSQPRRLDRVRARPGRVGRPRRGKPEAFRARAGRRGIHRQPHVRPASVRDRPDRPVLRDGWGREGGLGGDLGGRRGGHGDRRLLRSTSGGIAGMSEANGEVMRGVKGSDPLARRRKHRRSRSRGQTPARGSRGQTPVRSRSSRL